MIVTADLLKKTLRLQNMSSVEYQKLHLISISVQRAVLDLKHTVSLMLEKHLFPIFQSQKGCAHLNWLASFSLILLVTFCPHKVLSSHYAISWRSNQNFCPSWGELGGHLLKQKSFSLQSSKPDSRRSRKPKEKLILEALVTAFGKGYVWCHKSASACLVWREK